MKIFIFALLVLGFLTSCSAKKSEDIETSGFFITYEVVGDNVQKVSCFASFQQGRANGAYLELSGEDQVTCNGQPMSRERSTNGMIYYVAELPMTVGATYTLQFSRSGGHSYPSTVTLPETVTNRYPGNDQTIKKGSVLRATWAVSRQANADSMSVSFVRSESQSSRACPLDISHQDAVPEGGVLEFTSTETMPNPYMYGTCQLSLFFVRERTGLLNSELSGKIIGRQQVATALQFYD